MASDHPKPRVHFIANCVYGDHVAGGDIHFFNMAQAAIEAGYRVHFFGGHALRSHLEARPLLSTHSTLTFTDARKLPALSASLRDQLRLLADYWRRFRGTMARLWRTDSEDIVYAVTDYWFDTWPAIASRAKRKLMILGMDAPSLGQIVSKGRPDVTTTRLNSIYYWLSQNLSLRLFRFCRTKRLFYVHPSMKQRLLRIGYREDELVFISNGFDLETAERVPDQAKQFDVVWVGRVHRQKGISDLLDTLEFVQTKVPQFKAVLIGKLDELKEMVEQRGLGQVVTFAGLVSEAEKFRLFKASRVFLMPSRYESWGIVIGEALACGVPVVAYDLDAYRPIFGDLVNYIPRFDTEGFKQQSLALVIRARAGKVNLPEPELGRLKSEHSWQAARERFRNTLNELAAVNAT